MASLPSSLSSLLFLTLALILISVSPALSTSRQALDDHQDQPMKTGFKVTLNNVDSGGSFTERLLQATTRSNRRLQHFNKMVSNANNSNFRSGVYPADGAYFMNFSIGTPPKSYYGIMDTGSDLIWTQCRPCLCFSQPSPVFDPKTSSSYSNLSCSSDLCQNLESICNDGCEYIYGYGGGTIIFGYLATETFTIGGVSLPKIGFGCTIFTFDGEGFGDGLVGLGRGPLSLISQLDEPKFSYCLTSWEGTKNSTLVVGPQASVNLTAGAGAFNTTPLLLNPLIPTFYYVSLEGITIGGTKLPIPNTTFALNPDGLGGVIVDSGTTITFLEFNAYILVREQFISQVQLPLVDAFNETGLDLCFKVPSDPFSVQFPSLVFQFQNASLNFPTANYIIGDSRIACLAMAPSFGFSIFGNILQQNMLLVYDLSNNTLSFQPTKCDKF
ncbi:hypothetical protein Vadar_012425 [Vaccinium darrowii]|uniref:Uncharacterized protein n=1 Tax=Vaccinium darrowii TaxID=229202 RepID=A0ACB7XH25_9ERIC|nr:hypothetical protein Vadar_012425 [Vaccinium darrowii]